MSPATSLKGEYIKRDSLTLPIVISPFYFKSAFLLSMDAMTAILGD